MDGPNFSAFIEELAEKLHAEGKYLSVVVTPKTRDSSNTIDWQVIGQYADRVRILAYNYAYQGSPPGSISPPDAITALIHYAMTRIPEDKIEIALTASRISDWPEDSTSPTGYGKGTEIDNLSVLQALAAQYGATIEHDPETKTHHFSYTDSNGIGHQVWFEDAQSDFQKSELIRALGIANIGLWQLGSGDISQFFQLLGKENSTFPPPNTDGTCPTSP